MYVVVNRTEFLKSLRIVEKTISENKVKPILSCVYMETRDNTIFLCGTNSKTTITTTVECDEILQEGKVAFQYPLIDEYIKELKEDKLRIQVGEDILTIEGGDAISEFSIFSAEDYPKSFQNFETQEDHMLELPSIELADTFDKVKFSAGTSDNPAIHCVRMEGRGGGLHFVTTDTYRLTYLYRDFPLERDFEVSIPLDAIDSCSKIFRGMESNVKIYFDQRFVRFVLEEVQIITSLIELSYPKYETILENGNYNKKMTLLSEDLLNILKRVIIFVRNNEESKYGATLNLGKNTLGIKGISDIAKINEEIPVLFIGEALKVSLNTKYLFEFVQNLPKETEISLEFLDSKSSVKVKEKDKEDYIYILMPLALKE